MQSRLELPQYIGLTGSMLSFSCNIFLMYIIGKFSRPEYGSYRILMGVMAGLYVVYSSIDILVLPSYFVFGYNYFLFTTHLVQYQELSQILIVTFCSVFGCIQVVLSVQFIYRYLSVASFNYLREKYFKGRCHIVWVSATTLFFLNWFLVAILVFANHGDHPKELEEAVMDRFGRNVTDMAFTLVTYAQLDTNGKVQINYKDIVMILYLIFCASIPMTISMICGIKTWLKIQSTISLAQKSRQLQRQERQLFFALLTQFSIPFLGNTVPMLFLFLCPALYISPEPYTNYICILIPFYPVFDAIATTIIIKDYYRGVLKLFGLSQYAQSSSMFSTGGHVPPNTINANVSSEKSVESIPLARMDSQM
ncbi:Protein CBR-STR-82 [Caenorhabditis briggsae]|uniref:Protein CBR-STR-82 n=1 Tax=Caenorhabditis briggsae TaxID=6238 RepID=A8WQ05_CAEBR|nr:Protein CBR-STR-82 [Caenorhabditis briggsae]CAP22563.1 Protein CBR-STR-82 [Caenorhabditis briggsae]